MMQIRNRISIILFLSSLILLWNLTRNSPEIYDAFQFPLKIWQKVMGSHMNEAVRSPAQEFPPIRNKHSIILDSFKTMNYFSKQVSKDSTADSSILPSFDVWKEVELTRQGRTEQRGKIQDNFRSQRRKLNYASAKCGAKILASNKEAKYRTSILSEKIEEYMLNPCKAKTWFIVELCDTIEATQIELVNYELYSSSPRKFSTFWSDVYPTQIWHHLGTFEAKDQRTMQSFNLETENLGKFVKVTILSHYGTEHYCPLSVLRILGYSMVYEYEEIDMQNDKHENKKAEENDTLLETKNLLQGVQNSSNKTEGKLEGKEQNGVISVTHFNSKPLAFWIKACELGQKYCSDFDTLASGEVCLNQPSCLFLRQAIPFLKKEYECRKICRKKSLNVCSNHFPIPIEKFTSDLQTPHVPLNQSSRLTKYGRSNSNLTSDHIKDQDASLENNSKEKDEIQTNESASGVKLLKMNSTERSKESEFQEDNTIKHSKSHPDKPNIMVNGGTFQHKNIPKNAMPSDDDKQCNCRNDMTEEAGLVVNGDVADSAALIQKESVLVKLTTRIKTAETNLNLINRYLQQLSELYRQQMENMQIMFNVTVSALQVASEKASAIDRQQQISIERLECRVSTLNKKIDHLNQGHDDIWKRVLELHGFFVVLEIILMSTIISIFVNKLKKNTFLL